MKNGTVDAAEARRRSSELGPELPFERDVTTLESDGLASGAVAATGEPDEAVPTKAARSKPVAWRDLPRRDQLLILTLARLSEPLVQTSLQVGHTIR
jgi:hypothetical protein